MSARVRGWLRAPSTIVAAVLVVIGLLLVYLEGQSPSHLYWTGDTTPGTIRDGLVYYHVDGELYTLNDPDPAPAKPEATTVYYEPDDPSQALYSNPGRWLDAGLIVVCFLAAAACLIIAPLRQRRGRRRAESEPDWLADYRARRPPESGATRQ